MVTGRNRVKKLILRFKSGTTPELYLDVIFDYC